MSKAPKVIAETNFDNAVKLIEYEHGFVVTYGMQTRDCGSDFESAWKEFQSCSVHSATCFGYIEPEDYDG